MNAVHSDDIYKPKILDCKLETETASADFLRSHVAMATALVPGTRPPQRPCLAVSLITGSLNQRTVIYFERQGSHSLCTHAKLTWTLRHGQEHSLHQQTTHKWKVFPGELGLEMSKVGEK